MGRGPGSGGRVIPRRDDSHRLRRRGHAFPTGDGGARVHSRCPSGCVCIYPEINFGGQPWVRRASDGSVKDLPSAIPDRSSSIRNNSDRTARVYEKRNHAGRWVCVTRSGGSIHDRPTSGP
ncbi:peptidase inhibitor family I36 protein [Streptomyces sp. SudanB91_2054]|uniref:peptidase inhibitor family I36 protein n=1 Tax=Streptomyces sp. SudanB91_2054 TaxID=3035278 RepID=UPI0036D8D850